MSSKKSQVASKSDFGQGIRDRAEARAGKSVPFSGKSEFVNYTLDESERVQLKLNVWECSQYDDSLVKLIEEGYGVSIGFDDYSQCFMALLRPKMADNRNAGFLLSGRGSTPLKAIKQVCYIHWQVFDGDWGAHYQAKGKSDIDD